MDSLHLISFTLALSYVSGVPICKRPDDLHIQYKKLVNEMNEFTFLSLDTHIQEPLPPENDTGGKICPKKLQQVGETKDRSTCPWYNEPVYNAELYPSNWTKAVCLCEYCFGINGTYGCEPLLSTVMFLKQTKCMDGIYVYETHKMQIKTGCVCALRMNSSKKQ